MRVFTAATSLLSLLAATLAPGALCDSNETQPKVQLAAGTVTGVVDPSTPSVRQFLGIPYAEPPLGDLRFAPPQPPSRPHGNVNATAFPPSCMQFLSSLPGFYTSEVLEYNLQGLPTTGAVSEDCLTVSVWTPANAQPGDALPVMIFVYGGGFQNGGADVPAQNPARWIEQTGSHVVVVMNYRVNIFGFPSAGGLAAEGQNLGLLDQRLAVEWARDNVAAFGGDPTRMGLWGQSAGSMSVAAYPFAYVEDPIVNSLMLDSGTEQSSPPSQPIHALFSLVASQVGCGGLVDKPKEELDCMKALPAEQIEGFLEAYSNSGAQPELQFWPVADEKFVFADYAKQFEEGKVAKIPAIIGTNAQDGVPFAPYNPDGPYQEIADGVLLSLFFCPSFKTSLDRVQAGLTTFRYEYLGNFTNISPKPWMGAYHSAELPMLFGTYVDFPGVTDTPSTELEHGTSRAMQDAWLALVRDGPAGVESLGWPAYTGQGEGVVRQFGNGVAAVNGDVEFLEARC